MNIIEGLGPRWMFGAAVGLGVVLVLTVISRRPREESVSARTIETPLEHSAEAGPETSAAQTEPTIAQDASTANEEAAAQKGMLQMEQHEKRKREWMKSIGMEDEGTKPVDGELAAIWGR